MRGCGCIRRKNWKGSACKETETEKQREVEEKERRRKFELEKLKVESETKQKEIDALAKEKEAERDFELKKLQLQLQSQATESQSNTSVDGSGDYAVPYVPNIKLMKLPPFHEEKYDLNAYLNRFERTCRAFNVPQEQWSFPLARFLQGQALDEYQRMTDEDVSRTTACPDSSIISRTRRFPDNHFPGQAFSGQTFPRQFV